MTNRAWGCKKKMFPFCHRESVENVIHSETNSYRQKEDKIWMWEENFFFSILVCCRMLVFWCLVLVNIDLLCFAVNAVGTSAVYGVLPNRSPTEVHSSWTICAFLNEGLVKFAPWSWMNHSPAMFTIVLQMVECTTNVFDYGVQKRRQTNDVAIERKCF